MSSGGSTESVDDQAKGRVVGWVLCWMKGLDVSHVGVLGMDSKGGRQRWAVRKGGRAAGRQGALKYVPCVVPACREHCLGSFLVINSVWVQLGLLGVLGVDDTERIITLRLTTWETGDAPCWSRFIDCHPLPSQVLFFKPRLDMLGGHWNRYLLLWRWRREHA